MDRKCVGCGKIENRNKLIKVTVSKPLGDIIVNGDSKTFGRSAYLCYNNSCIENAFRKDRLKKVLKSPVHEDLKGKVLDELRNSQNK